MAKDSYSSKNSERAAFLNKQQPGSSFARGLRVFTTITEQGSVNAGAIAVFLDMPISSVYRFLGTLKELDLIVEVNNKYQLGSTFRALASQGLDHERRAKFSLPVLRRLVSETGETADLLVRSGLSAICVQEAESRFTMRIGLHVGAPLQLHAGAEQRVLLAFAPPQVIEEVISRGLRRYTAATLSADKLLSSLEQTRKKKIAISRGEYVSGAVAVGVPVFVRGQPVCSVGVAGPKERCTNEWVRIAAVSLAKASLTLTDIFTEY
jgi:DNA-binding IclR family transcriptional regulator